MPIWSEIGREIDAAGGDFDSVRRKYIVNFCRKVGGRNVILYASSFVQDREDVNPTDISVFEDDLPAFMEVSHNLDGAKGLDFILHSPGGSVEAAESIVSYLRSRFADIRVIVPHLAMSAATMIACAANRICLGKHSFLGPTDPQFVLATSLGARSVPAQSILDQFDRAQKECSENSAKLSVWAPILQTYAPDLLAQCATAIELSKELVEIWLTKYMFKDDSEEGPAKAKEIAEWLSDHRNFKSHARHIPRIELEKRGLKIEYLEKDEGFQDLVLSIFHATTYAFAETTAVKIVENHLGRAFIRT